ncbi:hypothetical protein CCE02nite_19280 [Cellulosimicrobium cellulans]|uniref:Fido domain-containing protein n=1 Tax=Cellulosimicrobium cellulans TaxID=1710 RepID=A0A4Y4DX05_CELCE|nr:hypothetical protein CCE02nite_19280 [Cellulosimicrobium cellulans]
MWIGGSDISPAGADFVPPHHERVPGAIADLVAFVARADVVPLAHVAIAHAQFETIHPFTDGNGRTGRALVQAMMHSSGLTRNATLPLSAGLLADVDSYYAALTPYRAGHPAAIVHQFVQASARAVKNGRQLVEQVRSIRARPGSSTRPASIATDLPGRRWRYSLPSTTSQSARASAAPPTGAPHRSETPAGSSERRGPGAYRQREPTGSLPRRVPSPDVAGPPPTVRPLDGLSSPAGRVTGLGSCRCHPRRRGPRWSRAR